MTSAASNSLKTRRVGRTDLEVTELGLGCATIGGIFRTATDDDGRATVAHAIERGIHYFDTAPFYGFGSSEHIVGDVLRHQRAGNVISTKVGRLFKGLKPGETQDPFMWGAPLPFKQSWDFSYDGIVRSLEDSQQRFGTNQIDILYVHDIGVKTHGEEKNRPLWEQLTKGGGYQALLDMKKSGLIKAIGLGVNDWEVILEAFELGDWDVCLLAGRYTLLEQNSLAFLETCLKRGTSIVGGGPLQSGILVSGTIHNSKAVPEETAAKVEKIKAVCSRYDVLMPAAAMQFPLAHKAIAALIPGPKTPAELDEILGWFNTPIPDELWDDLAKEGLIAEGAPLPNGKVAG